MPQSPIAKRVDAIIRAALAPELKKRGFRKTARSFRLTGDRATQLVNVQASMWNDRDEGTFTVNLGIFFPAVAALRQMDIKRPALTDCMMSERIGGLMPNKRDHWWEVSPATDDDALATKLRNAVVEFGLPWLAKFADPDVAAERTGPTTRPLVQAELQFLKGNRDAAIAVMTTAIAENPRGVEYWRPFAIATGLEAEFRAARGLSNG